jgi:hypothetical protein
MKTRIALFLILPALLLTQSKHDRQPAPPVLSHVTVIDVTGGAPKPDMTIVITGDRISQVEEAASTTNWRCWLLRNYPRLKHCDPPLSTQRSFWV